MSCHRALISRRAFPLASVPAEGVLGGRVGKRRGVDRAPGRWAARDRRDVHALQRSAGRGAAVARRDSVPVAPRVFQHPRPASRARRRRSVACRRGAWTSKATRCSCASRPCRNRRAAAAHTRANASSSSAVARRDSPRPNVCAISASRRADDVERRSEGPSTAEPVEGLPGRHHARGLDSAVRRKRIYDKRKIDLRTGSKVVAIDPAGAKSCCARGDRIGYDALLIVTGAAPGRYACPASTCRTCSRCARSPMRARSSRPVRMRRSVAFVGAGFIGMEAAGALQSARAGSARRRARCRCRWNARSARNSARGSNRCMRPKA